MRNPIYKDRIAKVCDKADWEAYQGILICGPENRQYLSGFTSKDHQIGETSGYLLLTRDRFLLLTDFRYEEQAKAEAPDFEVHVYTQSLEKLLLGLLSDLSIKILAYESEYLLCAVLHRIQQEVGKNIDMVPVTNLVESFRMIKDKEELQRIRASLDLTENVFYETVSFIKPGMTEKEIAWHIERLIREGGAEALAFPPIVASGPNSALPHAVPSERRIKAGEPIIIDMGAQLHGYCSDMTRTLCLGEPSQRFQQVYSQVRKAQKEAIKAVKSGIESKDVDRVARQIIDDSPFKGRFGHGLGHGVGLATHEPPSVGPNGSKTLQKGMVITIEPGIYIPGWGGVRLENMVHVTDNGCLVLNKDETFYAFT